MVGSKVREESVSVVLSEILEETGIRNISLLNLGKVPDIYLLLRGVRIIIETKEEGQEKELDIQLKQRIEMNLCEIAVGLEYPIELVKGRISAPSVSDIRKYLLNNVLIAKGISQSSKGYQILFEKLKIRPTALPELLSQIASEAMSDNELEMAVEQIREVIVEFANNMAMLENSENISTQIMEELELGKE
jgi:hypothetical protein